MPPERRGIVNRKGTDLHFQSNANEKLYCFPSSWLSLAFLTLIHKFSILPTSAGVQGTLSPDGVSGCPRKTFFLFSCRLRRQEKKGKVGRPHTPQRGNTAQISRDEKTEGGEAMTRKA